MKRILLKLSGEALAGEKHIGFDEATVTVVVSFDSPCNHCARGSDIADYDRTQTNFYGSAGGYFSLDLSSVGKELCRFGISLDASCHCHFSITGYISFNFASHLKRTSRFHIAF
mgnify:CR=1 FL=1